MDVKTKEEDTTCFFFFTCIRVSCYRIYYMELEEWLLPHALFPKCHRSYRGCLVKNEDVEDCARRYISPSCTVDSKYDFFVLQLRRDK